jgi:cobalt-zinc-cadmium efflux system protein
VVPGDAPGDAFLLEVCRSLKMEFGIGHATVQVESDPNLDCALAPDHVV